MSPRIDSRSADLLRSTALFLVVLVHAASPSFHDFNAAWSVSVFYGSLSRICIPLFFMLSGALLLEKQEPVARFLQKRAAKILIPTVFWSIVYLFYRKYGIGQSDASVDPVQLAHGPAYYHLWFMYAIIMVYLVTPLLRVVHTRTSERTQIALLALWFIGCSALPALGLYELAPRGFDPLFMPMYGGFMVLGALLARHEALWRFSRALLLFLVGSVSTYALTTWYSLWTAAPDEKFYDYLSPNVVLAAMGAYILIARGGTRISPRVQHALQRLSGYTFGIYFLHVIVLDLLQTFFFRNGYGTMIKGVQALLIIPLEAVATVLISLMLIAAMRRAPVLRQVV